jgi:hypothetical protein
MISLILLRINSCFTPPRGSAHPSFPCPGVPAQRQILPCSKISVRSFSVKADIFFSKTTIYDIIQLESVFMGVYSLSSVSKFRCRSYCGLTTLKHQIWERLTFRKGIK